MATLQTSGAISLSQVQSVLGGGNPISMSEYYRGGAYTPSTITTYNTVTEGPTHSGNYRWIVFQSTSYADSIIWAGSHWNQGYGRNMTSYSVSGYTFYRGSYYGTYSDKIAGTFYEYYISRSYVTSSSATVNTGVPSSGTISMSNFYGATK